MARDGWTPEIASQWGRIFLSFLAAGVGSFMLIWQTVFAMTPNYLIVTAGLAALGAPAGIRIDAKIRRNGNDTAPEPKEERL